MISASGTTQPTDAGRPTMRRLRLDLSYDGTDFSGWATQPGRRTVQGELEHWIATVLRLPGPVSVTCAGRTDAGVHARGQVAHVDLDPAAVARPTRTTEGDHDLPVLLERRLRRALPSDLAVHTVGWAPEGFDARFAAVARHYRYRLADPHTRADPLLRRHLTMIDSALDVDAMTTAASALVGLRDFAPFCKRREGATTIRTLTECVARRETDGPPPGVVEVQLTADAFCHSMVRSVVGALVAVGTGRRDADWLRAVAASPARSTEVTVLPPTGLVLERVDYPEAAALAARVREARAVRELP